MLQNLTHKKAPTINSGKFGERFKKICLCIWYRLYWNKNEWDTPVSVEAVVEAVKADSSIDTVLFQIYLKVQVD